MSLQQTIAVKVITVTVSTSCVVRGLLGISTYSKILEYQFEIFYYKVLHFLEKPEVYHGNQWTFTLTFGVTTNPQCSAKGQRRTLKNRLESICEVTTVVTTGSESDMASDIKMAMEIHEALSKTSIDLTIS